MDMRVSGVGNIPAGEYDDISVSGVGKLDAPITCTSFSCAGVAKGKSILCTGLVKTSGNATFTENVQAQNVKASGLFSCDGDMTVEGEITCSGFIRIQENVQCKQLRVAGKLQSNADVKATTVTVNGSIHCAGQLTAENVDVEFDGGIKIGRICASKISVIRKKPNAFFIKKAHVRSLTKGEEVVLQHVHCPQVIGRNVTVGKGCRIDWVQYTDSIDIHPKAKVKKVEKLNRDE